MTKKLLNTTTRSFLLFSVIILVIAAPLFYYMSHWLYVYETDEILVFHKNAFVEHNLNTFTEKDINTWNRYNRDVEIVPDTGVRHDSIFGTMYFDSLANEIEPFRELWAPIKIKGKTYTYIERNNLVEMEDMVYSVALMFLLIIITLMVGMIVLSNRLAKNIWKPFYDTLRKIQDFEIDKNRQPQFEPTDIEEFNSLNKSIEKLVEKNTAIYKSQREFVENAAHELQTPLALFQIKVDTLAQYEGLTGQQSKLIESLNDDISRLNRLNKNLLLLSKIDNGSYFDKEPVILNSKIEKKLDFFREQGQPKNISFELNTAVTLQLNTNPALAEILINNLFMNAIRHNIQDGKIIISTNQNQLVFSNTGSAAALNHEKLFNRFSKSDPSSQGNGLGLAIIKKITELNNWKISYYFSQDLHHFTVTFP